MALTRHPLLAVSSLEVEFQTRAGTVKALNGVSFHLDKGETLAIVGESGCGKSCSALAIMGLVPEPPGKIVAGKVELDGTNLLDLSDEQMRSIRGNRVSMIFQDPMSSLNPLLTVGTQISELLQLHLGMGKSRARQRCVELLHLVGMPDPEQRLRSYPHQLSGGMRQRVMIAMGLACSPEILIADEPTTALDVTLQAQIVELIRHLREESSMSVIWITHDLGVVAGLADRVMVMYAGHIVEEAPVDELFAAPQHPYTIGLLDSLPRVDGDRAEKLRTIRGLPPDLINRPPGCPFVERCNHAVDRCKHENPRLERSGAHHRVACWQVSHPGGNSRLVDSDVTTP